MRKMMLTTALAALCLTPTLAMAQNGTAAGAVTGAVGGALVGGPVGAVVGGVAGAAIGSNADTANRPVVVAPGAAPQTDTTCVTDAYGNQTCRSVTR